jgi:hypothetical protein
MAFKLVTPCARSSPMIGARSAAESLRASPQGGRGGLPRRVGRDGASPAAKPCPARLCSLQGGLRSGADHPPFFIGDERHNADRETIRVRHVDGDEVDAGPLQAEQEVCVSAQAIELRDHQRSLASAAHAEGLRELRTAALLSTSTNSPSNVHLPPSSQSSTALRCTSMPRPDAPCSRVETRK